MSESSDARYQRLQMALVRARETHALARHHEGSIGEIHKDIVNRETRHIELVGVAETEATDVEKLERLSLKRLQLMIREGVDKARIREQIEARAAVDAVAESTHELSLVTQELYRVEDVLSQLGDTAKAVELALIELDVHVRMHRPYIADDLASIEERLAKYQANHVECKEAETAGERAASELEKLVEELVAARRLSTWETFGGGLFVGINKKHQLRVSTERSRVAAQSLANFDRELLDTDIAPVSSSLGQSGSVDLLDIWFENFLIDLRVHDNIHTALKYTRRVLDEVRLAIMKLGRSMAASEAHIDRLDAKRLDLLTQPQDAR